MDVSRATNARKLSLCRTYFAVGFAFLPFMWAVNAVWFLEEAFFKPAYPEQKQIKRYVIVSGIGAVLWLAGIITWCVVFSLKRSEWGEFADNLSFYIPKGVP
ncbi:Gamma-secretase aspartyl protease complex presenilin enhancer-2 subunit [Trinorchestia longiramus]|nr:Gamma-secretase aspartyl protease complex presenilin enhancer-2 subunit [Trinorchestia longiramus]